MTKKNNAIIPYVSETPLNFVSNGTPKIQLIYLFLQSHSTYTPALFDSFLRVLERSEMKWTT
jgi:hypothetical protein